MKKRINIVLLILLIIIFNFVILINTVQAVEGEQIRIYTKGEFKRIIKYNGIIVKTAHAVYEKNGQEYPVYCLNKDLHGVGEYVATYEVTEQGKITDIGLWRVIINGYPYKTLEQLEVTNEDEAYTATKQAIYCYIYNRGTENYSAIGDSGNRVINAINKILENAKKSTETTDSQIQVIQDENWNVEENKYISKKYEIKSNINISKFLVDLENYPKDSKITNLENQEKKEFNSNEQFKILIPIDSLENDGQLKIKIHTKLETKPIFFGKAPSSDLQDYALTAFSYEDIDTEIYQKYEKNSTKIIINKQDKETQEMLKGAKFEILDKDKNTIEIAETNDEGQIILDKINPGIYYVKEIEAPNGYQKNDEIVKVEIKINEIQTIKIENNKNIIPQLPKIEIEAVEKLPVTGM